MTRVLIASVQPSDARDHGGDLIISETKHGFVCANAGVDRSNVADGWVVLLPDDPDRSATPLGRVA